MENGVFKPTTGRHAARGRLARPPTSLFPSSASVISPLLANIVLNHLDWPHEIESYTSPYQPRCFISRGWRLHEHGWRFVRYAD